MSSVELSKTPAAAGIPEGFHRLAPKSSVRSGFFMALIVTVVWTLITIATAIGLYSENTEGSGPPLWLPAIFVLVDLAFIFWLIKSFLRWTMTGQTTVDVSTATALPGEPIEVIVSQPGQFTIDTCNIDLICEEAATYTAGTDTETQREIVRSIPVCDLTSVAARNGQMLTRQTVVMPADAMLSFDAPNNKITWMVRVKMAIQRRPDSEQLFPIRMLSREILAEEGKNHG